MTQRWWAPAGAHIGPDATDFDRLKPGSDPKMDLGSALLTVHRVGAAACEAVAAAPMCSENDLIDALTTARLAFADPVVDAISKSVGEETYAALLVRDVVDDAERAALDLYRAAVAKGVAPPLAAQRVGAIYGVPAEELGTYRALATTPVASPIALTDAADRALFGYVSKLVEDEAPETQAEGVSKATPGSLLEVARPAPTRAQDDPNTPYYDARTADGRFATATAVAPSPAAASSLLTRLREEGATAPSSVGAPAARKTRMKRVTRMQRMRAAKPETDTDTQAKIKVKHKFKTRFKTKMTTRHKAAVEAAAAADPAPNPYADRGTAHWQRGMMLLPRPDLKNDVWPTLPHELVFHLTNQEKLNLLEAAEGQGIIGAHELIDPKRMRAGHLIDGLREGGGSLVLGGSTNDREFSYQQAVNLGSNDEYAPYTNVLYDVAGLTQTQIDNEMDDVARAWVREHYANTLDEGVLQRLTKDEKEQRIFLATDRHTGRQIMVHIPSLTPEGESIPMYAINEYIIPKGNVQGYLETSSGSERQARRVADASVEPYVHPNSTLYIDTANYEIDFDPNSNVLVNVYRVLELHEDDIHDPEEEIGKAVAVQDRPDTTYYDARDTSGRFAAASILDVVNQPETKQEAKPQTGRPTRMKRKGRLKRVRRAQTTQPTAEQKPKFSSKQRFKMTTRQRMAFQRAQHKIKERKRQLLPQSDEGYEVLSLSKNKEYVVMPRAVLNDILKAARTTTDRFTDESDVGEEVVLDNATAQGLYRAAERAAKDEASKDKIDGPEAESLISVQVYEQLNDIEEDEEVYASYVVSEDEDIWEQIAEEVDQLWGDYPGLVSLRLDISPNDVGPGQIAVDLLGNSVDIDPPVVVEVDNTVDFGKPVVLVYTGTFRQDAPEIRRDYKYKGSVPVDGDVGRDDESIANPQLQTFRLVGGIADKFKMVPGDYDD